MYQANPSGISFTDLFLLPIYLLILLFILVTGLWPILLLGILFWPKG